MIWKYYGIDWLIFLAVVIHLWLLGERKRAAFLFGMTSAMLGLIFSIQIDSIANGIAMVVYFCMHVRAYCKWRE